MPSEDYLKLNLPITAMQQNGRRSSNSLYERFLPELIGNKATILVVDALNVYRSSAKCLCNNGHKSLFPPGKNNDFKSFCIFLSLYIPAIILDHYSSEDEEIEPLVLDIVCKPSNWVRKYEGSPCDDNNILDDSKFMNITKDTKDIFLVSCINNYMMCTNSVVQAFIDEQNYGKKPIVNFSVAIPEQDINPFTSDTILQRRKSEVHGIDDLLAIKKTFMYRKKYPNYLVRLVTCDTMKTNSMQRINPTGGGIKEERREDVSSPNFRDHIRYIDIKSPPVDIAEVSIGSTMTSIYSHSAIDFWNEIENTYFRDVLITPFEQWEPPSVDILRCLYDQTNCKRFSLRRVNPIGRSSTRDTFLKQFFPTSQIALDIHMAKKLNDNGLYHTNLLRDPIELIPVDARECIKNLQNKSCNVDELNDFLLILRQQVEEIRRKSFWDDSPAKQ